LSLYLAHADRTVVAIDLARPSLLLGADAARRFGIEGVLFVESTCARPACAKVRSTSCSRSVCCTTHPIRARASRHLASLARPGGTIVLGLYNAIARLPLRLRRAVARLTGYRWIPFDPCCATAATSRRDARPGLRDQYRHPEEHRHTLREVQRWFAHNGIDYLRAYPSALLGEDPDDLFEPAGDDWLLEGWLAQWCWIRSLGHEGGLFVTVGRRRA
jgi:hypothetical protein